MKNHNLFGVEKNVWAGVLLGFGGVMPIGGEVLTGALFIIGGLLLWYMPSR